MIGDRFRAGVSALARGGEHMLRHSIGYVVVTLIILAQQNEMDLCDCLQAAYDEIKGRKGKTVNGVFVKKLIWYD